MTEVVVEQSERNPFESLCCGRDLSDHVDAVFVFLDHAMNSTHLALSLIHI